MGEDGAQQTIGRRVPGIRHGIVAAGAANDAVTIRAAWRQCQTAGVPKAVLPSSASIRKQESISWCRRKVAILV